LKVIRELSQRQSAVENLIRKYGYAPWHNYHHFQNWEGKGENFVFQFEKRGAIMARRKGHTWYLFSEILSRPQNRMDLFLEFLNFCFADPEAQKLSLEVEANFREQLLRTLQGSRWRACRPKYELTCTVFDLEKWEDSPKDKALRKIAKQIRSLYSKHRVEIVDSNQFSPSELKNIVEEWRKNRRGIDREYNDPYLRAIENRFEGTRFRRTIVVDGIASSITAGWDIPNRTGSYYSAFGIHNYRYDYLGDASYFDDLSFLKSQGIRFADFGGGWNGLLRFKMKFKPSIFYKTLAFSIKRADQ
jgi:hypothetical protein